MRVPRVTQLVKSGEVWCTGAAWDAASTPPLPPDLPLPIPAAAAAAILPPPPVASGRRARTASISYQVGKALPLGLQLPMLVDFDTGLGKAEAAEPYVIDRLRVTFPEAVESVQRALDLARATHKKELSGSLLGAQKLKGNTVS